MGKIAKIKAEIDSDPLTRGYSGMTDQQVADDMNTAYRPSPVGPEGILQYVTLETARSNDGNDTTACSIYGRAQMVAAAVYDADPLSTTTPGHQLEVAEIAAAQSFVRMLGPESQFSLDLSDSRFDSILQHLVDCQVMKNADKTAIQGLSTNAQTRAAELGLGVVKVGEVGQARSLP